MRSWLFAGKKIVSRLFFTQTLLWIALVPALFLPEYAPWLVGAVAVVMLLGGVAGQMLLHALSSRYAQLNVAALPADEYLIAVAGSGFQQHSGRAPESWFGDNLVIRLTEAGRVAQELAKRGMAGKICVSMPEHREMAADKRIGLAAFFARFGVPEEAVMIVDSAWDSEEEVAEFQKIPGKTIIVSNSWHIPRLMLAARMLQLPAIAAPAGQLFPAPKIHPHWRILPTAGNLQSLECALHEVMGLSELKAKMFLRAVNKTFFRSVQCGLSGTK